MDIQKQLEKTEKEKIKTELEFLKAQINPHFLFNSLNNILFQIDKTNHEARETLLQFSAMLRYQLYDCSKEFVKIEDEIQYLKNYIEIQMLRKIEKYNCHFVVCESVQNFHIEPFLLIPLVENAFKYVSHFSNRKNIINISINYRNDILEFKIINTKGPLANNPVNEYGGIGLTNLKRRLALLYEQQHRIEISETEDEFFVLLAIRISKTVQKWNSTNVLLSTMNH